MTKQQLFRRTLPIAISLIAVLLLAFSCSALKANTIDPELTDPDSEYATLGPITVTKEEVYKKLIDSFGASELSNLIDTDLLKGYIDLAKADQDFDIDEELEKSKFGGLTLEEVESKLTANEIKKYQDNFDESLVINGYESVEDFKELLYLNHARQLYAQAEVEREHEESSSDEPLIAIGDLKSYYEKSYYNEACAIKVKFSTATGAMDALHRAGLDINTDGEVVKIYYKDGEYIAPDDINNYPLDPEELKELEATDEEILEAYVNIYNERYGYREAITYTDGSVDCSNDDLNYNFEELSKQSSQVADYIFRVLDTERNTEVDEDAKPYTAEPVLLSYATGNNDTKHNAYFIMFKVSGDNQNVFRDLFNEMTDDEYAELLDKKPSDATGVKDQELLDTLLDEVIEKEASKASVYNKQLQELRSEHKLTIYDSFLEVSFNNKFGETVSNKGDKTIVYSYVNNSDKTVNVTADEFFNEMTNHAATAVMTIMNTELPLVNEDFITEIISEAKENEIKQKLTNYKLNFQQGGFLQYGFDPTTISWEDFMYSAFQVRSERDLYNALVKSELTKAYNKEIFNTDELLDEYYKDMTEYYEEAFEIDIMHLLIYIDNNEDASPDLILDNINNWTDNQHLLADELVDKLRETLEELEVEKITKEILDDIVKEYNDASLVDDEESENYSQWAKFKKAGLYIKVEDLGTVTSEGYEEEFENEARNMYEEMIELTEDNFISKNNISTRYGYHLMYSDKYKVKGDAYPEEEKDFPSPEDIEKYNRNDIEQSVSAMLFIERYYQPMKDKYLSNHEIVIYDNVRTEIGVTFKDSNVQETYNKILQANKNLVDNNA